MRRTRLFVGVLIGGLALPGAPAARPARGAEPEIVAVVACDGYADLKKQIRWIGTLVGNPALDGFAESFVLMATQFKGLAGLDPARPAGIVVTAVGDAPAIHGFVPVKDLDRLLDVLAGVVGPVEKDGAVRRVNAGGGMPLEISERDGWAIVAAAGAPPADVDPATAFAPVVKSFAVGAEVFPARMPEGMRRQVEDAVRRMAATATEGGPVDDAQLATAMAALEDTESFLIGLQVDMDRERIYLESRTTMVPGTAAAAAWDRADEAALTVAAAETTDGKPAAVSFHHVAAVPPEARAAVAAGLDQALADDGGDATAGAILTIVRDLAAAMLDAGGIDAGLTVDTSRADAERPLPDVTVGMRIKDGPALEQRLKAALGKEGALPPNVAVTFDAGRSGAANLHEVVLTMKDVPEAERFGGRIALTLAVTTDHAYLLAGDDVEKRLEAALGGRPDPDAKPMMGLDVSLAPLMRYAAALGRAFAPDSPENVAIDAMAETASNLPATLVQVLVRPIARGAAVRLSADAGAVKTIAAGVTATQAAGGAPRPFPLPAEPALAP